MAQHTSIIAAMALQLFGESYLFDHAPHSFKADTVEFPLLPA